MKILLFIISIAMLMSSCTKDSVVAPLPIISLSEINNVDVTSANYTGMISNDGTLVTERGICWEAGTIPTVADNKTINGDGAGTFSGTISGLTPNTKYYVRAYATNGAGTNYGSYISFTTQDGAIDADGNVYHAIKIGTQIWLTENLKTTKYNDNTTIPLISSDIAWQKATSGAYCWYSIDGSAFEANYGALYNWNAVNSGKLCPAGWHVPSDIEWKTLDVYLQNNGYNFNGFVDTDIFDSTNNYVAKAMASKSGWNLTSNVGAPGNTDYSNYENKSGFNAFPTGIRTESGGYSGLKGISNWWSSTELWTKYAWYYGIDALNYSLLKNYDLKNTGLSIRCIKN